MTRKIFDFNFFSSLVKIQNITIKRISHKENCDLLHQHLTIREKKRTSVFSNLRILADRYSTSEKTHRYFKLSTNLFVSSPMHTFTIRNDRGKLWVNRYRKIMRFKFVWSFLGDDCKLQCLDILRSLGQWEKWTMHLFQSFSVVLLRGQT